MPEPLNISPKVEDISVAQEGHDKIVTLVLRYSGNIDLLAKINEGQYLKMELPSKPQP